MINIAIIGCGHWGPNHVRSFSSLPNTKVVAVVDTDAACLSRMSETFPEIRKETKYQTVLKQPNIDAVVISTPTSTHHTIVRDALLAGKHVLCEKPLCIKSSDAKELIELAYSKKLALMIGHIFLFNPGILKLKELLDAGELGKVRYLSAERTNLGPIRTDVNAAFDLASHDISIFNWLFDSEPELVSAVGGSFLQSKLEDVAFISLKYASNILANIKVSWIDPKKVRKITVIGSNKMIIWDDLNIDLPITIYDKGAEAQQDYENFGEFLGIKTWDGDVRLPKVNFMEPLKIQNQYFVEALTNGAVVAKSGGKFSLGVVKVLEAVIESIRQNGMPVMIAK